jgi:hypothetical protein
VSGLLIGVRDSWNLSWISFKFIKLRGILCLVYQLVFIHVIFSS